MRKGATVLGIGLAVASPALASSPTWSQMYTSSGWSLESTIDNDAVGKIDIYTRTIGGVACFEAQAKTKVPADTLLDVAADIPSATKWSTAGLTDSQVLGHSENGVDYWQYLDVPGWTLASDRFWFLHGIPEKNDTADVFHWDRIPDGSSYADKIAQIKAERSAAVEPPINVGAWYFGKTADGTDLRYYICTDSGGSIPSSIQTAATRRTLPDTVADLVKEGQRRVK